MEHIKKFKETLNKIKETKSILQKEYHKFDSMEMAQIRSIHNRLIEAEIEAEIFIKYLQKKKLTNQKTMVIITFMSEGKLVTKLIDMDDLPWYLAHTTVYKTKPID